MKDYLIRGSANEGDIRFFCCSSKYLVEKGRVLHDCSPVATAALGRLLTAGCLMGVMLKSQEDKMTLRINGGGPAGSVVVTSKADGTVKGYIHNPQMENMLKPNGKLDVGGAVGIDGNLTVIMDLGMGEPYTGQIPLASGEIAEDLNMYYVVSEQIPSSVALGVLVDTDYSVKAAGGFIIQLMPDAREESIKQLEEALGKIQSVTKLLEEGMNCEDIIKLLLGEMPYTIFEEREIAFCCDCNRERIERVLLSLGEHELRMMIEEDEKAELTCQFCNKQYRFTKEELETLLIEGK